MMPNDLSGGMTRRVALARAIATDPKLMMYDEPFAGLDPISLNQICELIRSLNEALGLTSIVVTYDVQEALQGRRLRLRDQRRRGARQGHAEEIAQLARIRTCTSSSTRCPTARCASTSPGRRSRRTCTSMADSTDSIRKAATDAMKTGGDVTRRMRDLTLDALRNRRFDREGIRDVVRAVTEGMAAAAPASGGSVRQAMGQAFRGMDEALTKSVAAGEAALRQLVATGRGLADNEVKQALAGLKKIEEDFIDTVSKVASSANERARPSCARWSSAPRTPAPRPASRPRKLMAEFTFAGIELAGQFSVRFAQMASGVLAGMADALEKSAAAESAKKPLEASRSPCCGKPSA